MQSVDLHSVTSAALQHRLNLAFIWLLASQPIPKPPKHVHMQVVYAWQKLQQVMAKMRSDERQRWAGKRAVLHPRADSSS